MPKWALANSMDLYLYPRLFEPLFREFFGKAALFYSRQNVEFEQFFCWCCWMDIPSVCAIVLTRAKPKTHYNALVERYDRLKAQYDEVSTAISDNEARYEQMGRFITVLKDQEGVITEFDDALWSSLVEKIVGKSKEDVTVVFKDGTEMKAE